jgi:AcrR family transcriptional regulator
MKRGTVKPNPSPSPSRSGSAAARPNRRQAGSGSGSGAGTGTGTGTGTGSSDSSGAGTGAAAAGTRQTARAAPVRRDARAAAKRQVILDAALDEFSARGFADARIDDVAERAGVAKGTIYLYFKDKDALFQELVRTSLVPIVGTLKMPDGAEMSVRTLLEAFVDTLEREVLNTRRGDIIRLVISEGRRFPQLAEFHYREVIARGIAAMQGLIGFGIARGEIKNERLQEFPQLVIAPALVALLWQGMFAAFAPLDVKAMLRAHIDLLLGTERPS